MPTIAALSDEIERIMMRIDSLDGVPIACQVVGSREPALLFVHGFCCDQTYWEAQVPYFATQYKVVTIDLAGHGDSGIDRRIWNSVAFGNDVVSVIKKLNLKKVILVGHSMGGGVIAEAACQIPERVIALVGADTFQHVEQPTWSREDAETFLASLHSDFVKTIRQFVIEMFLPTSDPMLVEKVASDMSAAPPEVAIGMVRDRSMTDRVVAKCFDELKPPIYCIASDMHVVDADAAKRHASSFELIYMSNVGHFIMMEDPDTFNHLLSEIVKKLT